MALPGVTTTELAHKLSLAARAYQSSRNDQDLLALEILVRQAISRVRQIGIGSVDHIVLSGALKPIADEVPSVVTILQNEQWQWHL